MRVHLIIDGTDAARRAIGAADFHPLSVRRFAPAIKRLQRTAWLASKLAASPPLIRSAVSLQEGKLVVMPARAAPL